MILLEQLYRLLASDEQTRVIDPLHEFVAVVAASVILQPLQQVPERHALLLTHAFGAMRPGAAQSVGAQSQLQLRSPTGRVVVLDEVAVAAAANIPVLVRWQGEAIMTPGGDIRLNALFDAGVASNTATLWVHGVLIPLGNVERIV